MDPAQPDNNKRKREDEVAVPAAPDAAPDYATSLMAEQMKKMQDKMVAMQEALVKIKIKIKQYLPNVIERDAEEGSSLIRPSIPIAVGVDKLNSKASCGCVVSNPVSLRLRSIPLEIFLETKSHTFKTPKN